MAQRTNSLRKDIEELVNTSIEANKLFLQEGSVLLRQLGNKQPFNMNIFNNEFLADSLKAYTSLNIRHIKNMIELGMALTGEIINNNEENPSSGFTETPHALFILKAQATAGDTVQLQFILDNKKDTDVSCDLVHTPYYLSKAPLKTNDFETLFRPQSFRLNAGDSQTVNIQIKIPKNIAAGIYLCDVNLKGFEPDFFRIELVLNGKI